jgi:hypothetical protein
MLQSCTLAAAYWTSKLVEVAGVTMLTAVHANTQLRTSSRATAAAVMASVVSRPMSRSGLLGHCNECLRHCGGHLAQVVQP